MEQRDEKLDNILDSIEKYRLLKKYPADALNTEPLDDRDQLLRTLSRILKTLPPEGASTRGSTALCLSLLRTIEEIQFEGTLGRIQKKPGVPKVFAHSAKKMVGDNLFTFAEGCLPHPFQCHLTEFSDILTLDVPAGPYPYSTFTNVTSALRITESQHLHTVLRSVHDYLSERVNQEIYHHNFEVNQEGFIDQPEILNAAEEGLKPYKPIPGQAKSCHMDFFRGGCFLNNFEWKNKKRAMIKIVEGQKSPVISLTGYDLKTFLNCMDTFVKQLKNCSDEDRTLLKNYLLSQGGQETTHIAPASIRDLYGIHPAEAGHSYVVWSLSEDKEHLEAEVIYNVISVINVDDGKVYVLDPETEQRIPYNHTHDSRPPLLTIQVRIRLYPEDNAVVQKLTHYEVTSHAKDLAANPDYFPSVAAQKKV